MTGQFTTLFQGTFGSDRSIVAGINNNGDIVGDRLCSSCAIFDQGFLRKANGDLSTISFPGGLTSTRPNDINDSGQIVGFYFLGTCCNPEHGFLLENGSFATIDMPGASQTEVFGINNAGKIVGSYLSNSGRHGFLFQNGTFTTVDVPGSTATSVNGINDQDQLVGTFADATGVHGFIGRFGN